MNKQIRKFFIAGIAAAFLACQANGQAAAPPKSTGAQPSADASTEAELVGTLPYATNNKPIRSLLLQLGDGGSGPYKAVLVGDPNLQSHTIYRPRELSAFGAKLKMPIVAYGNGACRNASNEVKNFLTEVASHGFLVIAIGPALASALGGDLVTGPTTSSQLLQAIDWAATENARAGSPLFGKVDTTKVAVMGQSCGGLQAIEVSDDPRITTTVMLNSGIFIKPFVPPPSSGAQDRKFIGLPMVTKEKLAQLHAPILYLIGGKIDIAHENAADDFAKIDKVPVFMANREVGHYPATYLEPRGGAFGEVASAWLAWQLKGDQTAAKMFTGEKCGLCSESSWTIERKGIR